MKARRYRALPRSTGRWKPLVSGLGTPDECIVGWVEVFRARGGRWVSVPGSSRFVDASTGRVEAAES